MTVASRPSAAPTWGELKELLRWLAALFGEPRALYDEHIVERATALLIRSWIAALEAMTRALLVLMAAELPAPAQTAAARPPRGAAPPSRSDDARPVDPLTDEEATETPSEQWPGVAFAYMPARREERSWPEKRGVEPVRFLPTRRLAFRFEALLRVAEAPERYALRMAQRLRRNRRLAARILRPPQPAGKASWPSEEVGRALASARLAARRLGSPPGCDTG